MTNPRAHAQSNVSPIRKIREKLKRFFGPWGMFVKGFIKHPVMVGSIVPSSPTLIRHMLRPVDWKNTKLFVEYGPGVGTFCRPVLERMAGDATLIAIDTNEDFIDYLRANIRDSRFIPVLGSAADVEAIIAAAKRPALAAPASPIRSRDPDNSAGSARSTRSAAARGGPRASVSAVEVLA